MSLGGTTFVLNLYGMRQYLVFCREMPGGYEWQNVARHAARKIAAAYSIASDVHVKVS